MSSPDRVVLYFSAHGPGVTALFEQGSERFSDTATIADFLLWLEALQVPGKSLTPVILEVAEQAPKNRQWLASRGCQVDLQRHTNAAQGERSPGFDRVVLLEPETVEEAARQWLNIDAQAALQTLLTHLCVLQAEIAQPLQIALRFDQPIPTTE